MSMEHYAQPTMTRAEMEKQLTGVSPLKLSRRLIDIELYERQSSMVVMDKIYEDFANKNDLVESLVVPCLSTMIGSSLDFFKKRGMPVPEGETAHSIINEVRSVDYSKGAAGYYRTMESKALFDKLNISEDYRGEYKNNRSQYEDTARMDAYKESNSDRFGRSKNELNDKMELAQTKHYADRKVKEGDKQRLHTAETDHVVSLEKVHSENKWNLLLDKQDMVDIMNDDVNYVLVNGCLNAAKGGSRSFGDIVNEKQALRSEIESGNATKKQQDRLAFLEKRLPKAQEQRALEVDKNSREGVDKLIRDKTLEKGVHLGGEMLGDAKNKVQSAAVTAFFKALAFELFDCFKNGLTSGFSPETSDGAAIGARLKRVATVAIERFKQASKGQFFAKLEELIKMLLKMVIKMVQGMLKNILKIIVEGWSAIVGAIKILTTPSEQMSAAQKGDAIVKLLATTTATIATYYFVNLPPPLDEYDDLILPVISGLLSTLVVWGLDKLDLFSAKAEARAERVKDIFAERVKQIKANTDAYESASLERLAQDKLRFAEINTRMATAIQNKQPVNDSIYDLAQFFDVDLQLTSTDDFMALLETGDGLVVA
ncbi:hypothetical protein [Ferrimonas aestuarii]|uniref:Uncharacterized protein n=1 Tax=Ferrimonas aestuarii TaxID=2569539 RepID=A0A4U1BMH3_9GAMM|nr:hypothetical protein [Ferrimonas aestuarii]TKB52751.1 hypothetical protein FCL42_15695 [Ferrimonas aestuarii]